MTATLDALKQQFLNGTSVAQITDAAEQLARTVGTDPDWFVNVFDEYWRPIGAAGDFIECSGTDPRNQLPSGVLKLKGDDPLIPVMMNCSKTMVGVTVETEGMRFPFYVDTHEYNFDKGQWIGTANLLGIWDILNYLQIWPDWFLPIQAQILSHAIYIGPICTCIEAMIAEQAFRIQTGLNEFINNALSLNPDFPAWFGSLQTYGFHPLEMLKCPIYVVRHDPLLDTSPLICRTVRMESCGAVIKDITRAYGIDVRVDLWLPGDPQPDTWTATIPALTLDQPTYVVTVRDRSEITGPTKTVIDSVLRTTVDFAGSLGLSGLLAPILDPQGPPTGLPQNYFVAPTIGVNWVAPWALLIAPEPGDVGSVYTCKIVDHTPKGWQHIIGGRSPQWLNDLMNALWSWIIDSITILIGITGIPSDLLAGFLNNSFLAFQLIEDYDRRNAVGPYHPGIEVFHATSSAPYNLETLFGFINALWDSRGWTCVQATFRNGEVYTLGRDVFRGALMSVAYLGRTRLYTDYVDNTLWRIDKKTRDVMVQVGDGKAIESPLAKHQRNITGIFEALNVLTLAPQSG